MSSSEDTPKSSPAQSSDEVQEKVDPASQGPLVTSAQPSEDRDIPGGALRERTIHGWKWVATAASLYIGALIYGLDSTIVADIQPALIQQFNDFESLTWAGTGFPLGSFCSILPGLVGNLCLPA